MTLICCQPNFIDTKNIIFIPTVAPSTGITIESHSQLLIKIYELETNHKTIYLRSLLIYPVTKKNHKTI